jgi:hypothetical protein
MSEIALSAGLWHPGDVHDLPGWAHDQLNRIYLFAGSKSDYLEKKILDLILSNTAYTVPTNVYIGLWTSALTDASAGNTAGEVSTSGTAYDRLTVANNSTNWPAATGTSPSSKANASTASFSYAQATGSWGTVTYMGIFDGNAKTSGDNLLLWADLTVSKAITTGDTASFAAGAITWTED